jgi:hypothetical protein
VTPLRALLGGTPARLELAIALVALAAFGCSAPSTNPRFPPQWIEVSMGPVQRDEDRTPELEEDFVYGVGGGYDLLSRDHVRAGFELGFDWGRFDIASGDPQVEEDSLDAWTWLVGARVLVDALRAPFGLHARAGGFWRDEEDFSGASDSFDQGGGYFGGGLDWYFKRDMVLSFFALHLAGADELDETRIGLSARFYFAPEVDPSEEPDWWW